jgi:hypothetical protein
MATKANIGARLDALEQRRDHLIDGIMDQYLARCDELMGVKPSAWADVARRWQADPAAQAADEAMFAADPIAQKFDAAFGALVGWRGVVDRLQGRNRDND